VYAACAIVGGSAVGFAAAAFSVFDVSWLRPYSFPSPHELHLVGEQTETGGVDSSVPLDRALTWRDGPLGADLGWYDVALPEFGSEGARRRVAAIHVSSNLLTVLADGGAVAVAGELLTEPVVLLGEQLWRVSLQGEAGGVASVSLDGESFPVAGRIPEGFSLPVVPDPAIVVVNDPTDGGFEGSRNVHVVVRSREGSDGRITTLLNRGESGGGTNATSAAATVALVRFRDASGSVVPGAWLLLAVLVATLVLSVLSSCYILLSTAGPRSEDWAVRRALGASNARLVLDLARDMAILAVGTGLGSWVLLVAFAHWAAADIVTAFQLPRAPAIDLRLVGFVLGGVVLQSIAPVLLLGAVLLSNSRSSRLDGTRPAGFGMRAGRLGRWLIGIETAIASLVVLLGSVTAGLYFTIVQSELGFDLTEVLHRSVVLPTSDTRTPEDAALIWQALERELAAIPGVKAVALVDILPFLASPPRELMEVPAVGRTRVAVRRVSPSYFDVLGVPTLDGRSLFTSDERPPAAVMVVNQDFVTRFWPGEPAIGRTLPMGGTHVSVVGVVPAFRERGLTRPSEPTIYVPYSDRHYRRFSAARGVLLKTMNGRSELVAERAEVIAKRYDPSLNRESTRLLETRLEPSLRVPRLFAAMAGAFAWMAVLIGGFGVSSVVNQVTDRRRYETAVRVMCGATPADVLASYLRYVGTPATLGVMVGCYVGWVLGHQFVDEIDAGTRLSVSAVLVGTLTALVFVAAGVVVPSVRAAVREPLLMLKVK
jgi:hypothetical protein